MVGRVVDGEGWRG
jgi:hypothetical protein